MAMTDNARVPVPEVPSLSALPLAPFEEYMWLDDRPAYPMNFFLRLRFAGGLAPELFDNACRQAVARHPLLAARLTRRKRRWYWSTDDLRSPAFSWDSASPDDALSAATPIDLKEESGLRIVGQQAGEAAAVTFQFHHAACDGLGAFQYLGDVLTAYSHALGETKRTLGDRPLDLPLLQQRGTFGLTRGRLIRMLPRQLLGVIGARQFFMRQPLMLAGADPNAAADGCSAPGRPPAWPASLTRRLTARETRDLRAAARNQQVTVNDVLARDWFLALGEHQRAVGEDKSNAWLRTCIPISLRGQRDSRMPAANLVSMVFLDRRPPQLADPATLLRSIRKEMDTIRRNRLEFTFVFSLGLGRRVFRRLHWLMPGEKCTASSVLTNLGDLFGRLRLPRDSQQRLTFARATLEGIDVLAPLRPGTRLALAVFRYAGRQSTTLHYDPRHFSAPQAAALLDTYRNQVRASAATAADSPSARAGTNPAGGHQ